MGTLRSQILADTDLKNFRCFYNEGSHTYAQESIIEWNTKTLTSNFQRSYECYQSRRLNTVKLMAKYVSDVI